MRVRTSRIRKSRFRRRYRRRNGVLRINRMPQINKQRLHFNDTISYSGEIGLQKEDPFEWTHNTFKSYDYDKAKLFPCLSKLYNKFAINKIVLYYRNITDSTSLMRKFNNSGVDFWFYESKDTLGSTLLIYPNDTGDSTFKPGDNNWIVINMPRKKAVKKVLYCKPKKYIPTTVNLSGLTLQDVLKLQDSPLSIQNFTTLVGIAKQNWWPAQNNTQQRMTITVNFQFDIYVYCTFAKRTYDE